MSEDVEHVPRFWVYDWQPMDLVLDERADGVEERRVRVDPDELLGLGECAPPRLQLVLLEFLHLDGGALVVHLEDLDEVGDGEHANELLLSKNETKRIKSVFPSNRPSNHFKQIRTFSKAITRVIKFTFS